MNRVLKSTRNVIEKAKLVRIDQAQLEKFADNFDHSDVSHWLNAAPLDLALLSNEEKLNFLLIFNSVSFCYWGDPKWTIEYRGENADGAWGMITAIGRAMHEGIPIFDPTYRSRISKEDFAHLLRGNVEIPLLNERHKIFQETGFKLLEKWDGDFSKLVSTAEKDAIKLLNFILETFPSFEDTETYDNQSVYFLKRAQLLVADIYQLFGKRGYGELLNVGEITACADYKLPQALRKFGILNYSPELASRIDQRVELISGSPEEVEIRASVIWAVEMIKQRVHKRLPQITSMEINDHIWLYTQTKRPDDKPYHLTRTTAY